LLPVGILLSWLVIPNPVPVKLLKPVSTELLPVIKYTTGKKEYSVNIRTNRKNTDWQLEWKNKMALTVPSAVIYQVKDDETDITKAQLIGRIEAKGDYVFQLKSDSSLKHQDLHFLIYDFIHEKIIDSLNFKILVGR
ncbi:MAG TPA: hypothetical protein VJU78_19085, partial [Chitinophagaceae bacterium]|nr:hypothetical protein [Chitinophagaceae bacterium]